MPSWKAKSYPAEDPYEISFYPKHDKGMARIVEGWMNGYAILDYWEKPFTNLVSLVAGGKIQAFLSTASRAPLSPEVLARNDWGVCEKPGPNHRMAWYRMEEVLEHLPPDQVKSNQHRKLLAQYRPKTGTVRLSFYMSESSWYVGETGREKDLGNRVGFRMIHLLLRYPDKEIPSTLVYHGTEDPKAIPSLPAALQHDQKRVTALNEQARKNVAAAIKRALKMMPEAVNPYLNYWTKPTQSPRGNPAKRIPGGSIKLGTYCAYHYRPGAVDWKLDP